MENLQERHHPIPDGAVLSKIYCIRQYLEVLLKWVVKTLKQQGWGKYTCKREGVSGTEGIKERKGGKRDKIRNKLFPVECFIQGRSVHVNRGSPANTLKKRKIKSLLPYVLLSWFSGTPCIGTQQNRPDKCIFSQLQPAVSNLD
jgi:hypothetical protein